MRLRSTRTTSRVISPVTKATALALALTLPSTGCLRGPGGLFVAMAGTALVTAAIVSSRPPPPPRVVYVPPPRPGYAWQPGYWALEGDDEWVWVEGRWVATEPGYRWVRTRWVQDPDGRWHLIRGHWAPIDRPPPPDLP